MSSLENGWMGLKSQEATLNEIEELKKKNRGAQRKFEFHGKCKTTDNKILQLQLFAWTRLTSTQK